MLRDAAEQFARSLAPDEPAEFVRLFVGALNLGDDVDADGSLRAGAQGQLRTLRSQTSADGPSIYRDPTYVANSMQMIGDETRIIGGVQAPDFPDCVAIGRRDRWCCSGTLVAANVVVTAGHCARQACCARVFVGADTDQPASGRIVPVAQTFTNPGYQPPQVEANDLAVLILAEPIDDVPPRSFAPAGAIDEATVVRIAGYGYTDVAATTGYGHRRMVEVPLASADPAYGAQPGLEFVAGEPFLNRDSCNGDSGGPAYLASGGDWHLAGATSRWTAKRHRPCGDGGIYTRLDKYEDWIRTLPGGAW